MKNEILEKLLVSIDLKRKEMIKYAKDSGFTSEKTVKCSQELDTFLNQYYQVSLYQTS